MLAEMISLEHNFGEIPPNVEYRLLNRGKDCVYIKYKGSMRCIPNTYIARKKFFTQDNEDNLPTYEEIMEKESEELQS